MVWNSNITSITATGTLSISQDVYIVDATGGSFTISLPSILADGMNYKLIRTDSTANTVTIQGSGGQLINGLASVTLNANRTMYFESFNSGWYITNTSSSSSNAAALPISLRFDDLTGLPLIQKNTSFLVVSNLVYWGTSFSSFLTQVLAVVSAKDTSTTGEIKISNFTAGGTTICTTTFGPFANAPNPNIIDFGAISNLPSSSAIFQVQIRRVTGSEVYLSAVEMFG